MQLRFFVSAFLALAVAAFAPGADAALKVWPASPSGHHWCSELAGDHASVYVATTALQDPHRIQAKPSLIASARSADLVVCNGRRAGNRLAAGFAAPVR